MSRGITRPPSNGSRGLPSRDTCWLRRPWARITGREEGFSQDLDKAYFWSILARAGGDEASKYRVAALASRMSRSQIIAAQAEANDWLQQRQLAGKTSPGSHP